MSGRWRLACLSLLGALVCLALAVACKDDEPPEPLTYTALENAAYPTEVVRGGTVQLKDGVFSEAIPNSSASISVRMIDARAEGDLDADKAPDAAVVLAANTGGSGTFYDLVAVLNKDGVAQPAARISLGDRVVVQSLAITGGRIVAKLRVHGPSDPLCCPTLDVTKAYALTAGKLEPVP
jgi:hypothetical protein